MLFLWQEMDDAADPYILRGVSEKKSIEKNGLLLLGILLSKQISCIFSHQLLDRLTWSSFSTKPQV